MYLFIFFFKNKECPSLEEKLKLHNNKIRMYNLFIFKISINVDNL
jgi:hypothetical protein